MPSPNYWFSKINEAISKPKGDHAYIARQDGGYIDRLLDDSMDSPNLSEIEVLAAELREYICRNRTSKFRTIEVARKLVCRLKELVKT